MIDFVDKWAKDVVKNSENMLLNGILIVECEYVFYNIHR